MGLKGLNLDGVKGFFVILRPLGCVSWQPYTLNTNLLQFITLTLNHHLQQAASHPLLGGAGDLVSKVISRVISTLHGVTPIITLLINYLLSPLTLQVDPKP